MEGDSGIEPGNRKGMKGRTNLELVKWVFSGLFKHRDIEFKQGGEIWLPDGSAEWGRMSTMESTMSSHERRRFDSWEAIDRVMLGGQGGFTLYSVFFFPFKSFGGRAWGYWLGPTLKKNHNPALQRPLEVLGKSVQQTANRQVERPSPNANLLSAYGEADIALDFRDTLGSMIDRFPALREHPLKLSFNMPKAWRA